MGGPLIGAGRAGTERRARHVLAADCVLAARRVLAGGLLPAALALAAVSCGAAGGGRADAATAPKAPPSAAQGEGSAPRFVRGRVVTPGGRAFAVEVVQDPESRERGLQNRASLPRDQGMVFVFPAPARHRFWMYLCLIPLDIIWMDAGKTVVYVGENLPVCRKEPCPDYGSDHDTLYVLELGAGVAKEAGIKPGTHLTILFDHPPNPR